MQEARKFGFCCLGVLVLRSSSGVLIVGVSVFFLLFAFLCFVAVFLSWFLWFAVFCLWFLCGLFLLLVDYCCFRLPCEWIICWGRCRFICLHMKKGDGLSWWISSDWVISLWVLVVFPLWWSDLLFLALFLVLFWLVLYGIILALPAPLVYGCWMMDM